MSIANLLDSFIQRKRQKFSNQDIQYFFFFNYEMSHLLMRNISLKEELHYHYVFLFPCGHLYSDQ